MFTFTMSKSGAAFAAALALSVCACGGSTQKSSGGASSADTSATYDLEIEGSSYAFLGPTLAGGAQVGIVPAGAQLTINYERSYTFVGLSAAPTALAVDWTIDGGAVQTAAVQNEFGPTDGRIAFNSAIDIPSTATTQLQVWFQFTAADGTVAYDSQSGSNYVANILPSTSPVISFAAPSGGNWPAPTVQGTLTAGGTFQISYDFARLAALGADPSTATVEAFANYEDANGNILSTGSASVPNGSLSTALTIASGTALLEVYFVDGVHDNLTYDSNFGQNFGFNVQ